MANQPTKYKKFIATAATATLVASAIVPVASAANFQDISGLDTEAVTAINALADLGVINDSQENYNPTTSITRGQVVKMLGKWVEAKGQTLPADWNTTARFNDLSVDAADQELVKYAALAKDAGVFNGSNGNLNAGSNITRGQMALVLDRAYKALFGTSLVDLAANIEDVTVADLESASTEQQPAIQALADLGITVVSNYNPAGNVTRAQFALFVYRSANTEAPKAAVAVESVSAVNAKSLKVTFNTPVDTTKATIAVKKGSVTSNVSATTWNDAKTEVTLELAGKLTEGEYTVAVTGVSEEALTGSVKVENERVEAVKILSDKAVLKSDKTEVTVGYKVENQYGEDITANYTVNPSAAGVNVTPGVTAIKGLATIPVNSSAVKEGDSVVLTLVHVGTGKSVSQTLTVSAAAAVSDITITGVYNKDGKTLNETSNLSRDAFYLLVDGKDQYGNAVKADALNALLKNNTNPLIVGLGASFETVKVNGVDKTALRLTGTPKAGTTNVMLISPTTGKSASSSVVVAEAQRADKITFDVPQLVVADEALFVPVTVLDKEGNAITDLDILNNATRGVTINGDRTLSKNSKGVIGYTVSTPTEAGYVSLVGLTSTAKSEIVNIQVKEEAKPTVVRGLTSSTSAVLLDSNKTIADTNLVVEDQYGRAMTDETTELTLAADADAASGYRIAVTDNETNSVIGNGGVTSYIYASTDATLTKGTNGAEKVEFVIEEKKNGVWTAVAGSSQEIEFRVTDGTEYASYEVEEIGAIFDEVGAEKSEDAAYSKELVVYGVLDDGKKIELDPSKYTVTAPTYLGYSADKFNVNTTKVGAPGSEATPAAKVVPYADKATELKANVVVTINATGTQFTKEVTVSKVAPKVTEFKVVAQDAADAVALSDSKITTKEYTNLVEFTSADVAFLTSTAVNTVVDFVAVDSYGVISLIDNGAASFVPQFKLVGTPAVAHTVAFTNQNASTLELEGLEKGEKVTVNVTVDGLSKSFVLNGTVATVGDVADAKADLLAPGFVLTFEANTATPKLTLAPTGSNTTNITWSSSNTDVLSNAGVVTRPTTPATAATVTLTATITKGSASTTQTFTVVVPNDADADAVAPGTQLGAVTVTKN